VRYDVRDLLRAALRRAGWTIHRWPANRFDAMDDALRLLRRQGFNPAVVVDVGANRGLWTDLAARVFEARQHHLIEPLPGCQVSLARFQPPRFYVHPVALTAAGTTAVTMSGASAGLSSTGAWVAAPGEEDAHAVDVPATTLDELLGSRVRAADRPLLKLDAEGHELTILGAGTQVLAASEVVITESRVFPFVSGQPALQDVVTFMHARGFQLYDVAALAPLRPGLRLGMCDVVFVRADSALAAT